MSNSFSLLGGGHISHVWSKVIALAMVRLCFIFIWLYFYFKPIPPIRKQQWNLSHICTTCWGSRLSWPLGLNVFSALTPRGPSFHWDPAKHSNSAWMLDAEECEDFVCFAQTVERRVIHTRIYSGRSQVAATKWCYVKRGRCNCCCCSVTPGMKSKMEAVTPLIIHI